MKQKAGYLIFLVLTSLTQSCKVDTCTNGTPYVQFIGFNRSELSIIEVKEYEPGSGWGKLKRTFYTGDSIKTQSADSIPWQKLQIAANSFYVFRILESGTSYSLYNMEHKKHKMKRYVGSERKGCTNGFSYRVNTTNFSTPYKEYLTYGQEHRVVVIINK